MTQQLQSAARAAVLRCGCDARLEAVQRICAAEQPQQLIEALARACDDEAARPSFDLLMQLVEALWSQMQEHSRTEFIALWQRCAPDAAGITRLMKLMQAMDQTQFPLQLQTLALRTLGEQLRRNSPKAIVFPGSHDSFLRVSPVKPITSKGYTVALWIKLGDAQPQDDILLFRCESSGGEGIEVMLTERQRDGRWTVTIRVLGSPTNVPRDRTVIFGTVFLPSEAWQLLTLSHVQQYLRHSRVCLKIDGQTEFEQELHFPFATQATDARWTIGSGLRGRISSFAVYPGELVTDMLTTLNDNGPGCGSLDTAVAVPQSTLESGHSVLGIQVTKGETGRKCFLSRPILAITPVMCQTPVGVPYETIGAQHMDHIEMVDQHVTADYTSVARLQGSCTVDATPSWSDVWSIAGGPALVLRLLWGYCGLRRDRSNSHVEFTDTPSPTGASSTDECIQLCIHLLAALVRASIELRESFLQMHGFHVVAACLFRLKDKENSINVPIVDACMDLVRGFGADGRGGDGLAAALQGLLFDFRLWGATTRFVQAYLLHAVSDLLADAGRALHDSVGVQQIIDIMRLYVCRQQQQQQQQQQQGASSTAVVDQHQLACADACHKLLSVALDAGLSVSKQTCPEIEVMVLCLEETNSVMLIERLVRALVQLRFTFPEPLRHTLCGGNMRFLETTNIYLLTKKGFSAEVRKNSMMLLIWLLSDEEVGLAGRVSLKLGQAAAAPATSTSRISPRVRRRLGGQQASTKAGGVSEPGGSSGNSSSASLGADSSAAASFEYSLPAGLPVQLHEPMKHLYRGVQVLQVANELLKKALEEGAWTGSLDRIHDITELLIHDGPLGSTNVWIVLPLLDVFLKYSDIRMCQQALMSLSVALKSDEAQVETLCLLPDNLYVEHFVNFAVLAEIRKSVPGGPPTTGVDVFSGELASLTAVSKEEQEIATVCSELALDCLATTLAHHMRRHGRSAWTAWEQLDECLKAGQTKSDNPQWELRALQRTTLMVVQRLTRASEPWNEGLIPSVSQLLRLAAERMFPAQSPTEQPSTPQPGTDESRLPIVQEQLLYFVIEIMASIRKATDMGEIASHLEGRILIPAMEILIAHMQDVGGELASKVSGEIFSAIVQLSAIPNQRWFQDSTPRSRARQARSQGGGQSNEPSPPISSEEFAHLVFQTLSKCRTLLSEEHVAIAVRDRYTVLVISLVQYFADLHKSVEVPAHVAHVAGALQVASGHDSVEDIFRLLDISMRMADSISFEASDESDFMVGNLGAPESPSPQPAEENLLDLEDTVAYFDKVHRRREYLLGHWWQIRQGIMQERVDTERSRLSRAVRYHEYDADATLRHWKKLRFKVEFECLQLDHDKEWKLGIAHEGPYPSRRRITLRPRYDGSAVSELGALESSQLGLNSTLAGDELKQALAKAYRGYIQDVTTQEVGIGQDADDPDSAAADPGQLGNRTISDPDVASAAATGAGGVGAAAAGDPQFGQGWGLVDADGSDEGFGVIGVAPGAVDGAGDAAARTDQAEDLKYFEQNQKPMRQVETGPCYGGVRRSSADSVLREAEVSLITPSGKYSGTLSFTAREILFVSSVDEKPADAITVTLQSKKKVRRRRWLLSAVSYIFLRRYRLRDSALEIFFRRGKHRSLFVDFGNTAADAAMRNEFVTHLNKVAPRSAYKQAPHTPASRMLRHHRILERWQAGEMSNFDYLMALNTLAGRSYNDLCQYPVFPWVIAQYDQPTIDLDDPSVYRNLAEPMGAINKDRLAEFMDRYETFSDDTIPKFMYGSHYSTMVGVVLHFLLRLQPFADLHRDIQGGHFDVPDRLFSSIPRAWDHNTTLLSEVKELTPEWYSTPDFLRNINGYNFGVMQDGEVVGEVALPPWASTPEDFIKINRAALESDFVSANLHQWIDLIFGYKQRGPAAVEAHNVFYYLTYYGLVDVDAIEDEALRRATELQIAHFGQCPDVLFAKPHPPRKRLSVPRPLLRNFHLPQLGMRMARVRSGADLTQAGAGGAADEVRIVEDHVLEPLNSPAVRVRRLADLAVRLVTVAEHRVVVVAENGVVELYRFALSEEAKQQSFVAPAEVATSLPHDQQTGSSSQSARTQPPTQAAAAAASTTPDRSVSYDLIDFSDETPTRAAAAALAAAESVRRTSTSPTPGQAQSVSVIPHNVATAASLATLPLISIEKDREYFEVLPRVPYVQMYVPSAKASAPASPGTLRRASSSYNPVNSLPPSMTYYHAIPSDVWLKLPLSLRTPRMHATRFGGYILTAGHADGRVAVRELDDHFGQIRAAGDFCCHRSAVLCLSSDAIPRCSTDVVATADCDGLTLVWTVSRANQRSVISRRPQRAFHGPAMPAASCAVSWSLGVVATAHGSCISVYSIERDEKLRAIDIEKDVFAAARITWANDLLGTSSQEDALQKPCIVVPFMEFSSNGYIIVSVIVALPAAIRRDSSGRLTSLPEEMFRHVVLTYTVSGFKTGVVQLPRTVTFLSTPARGEVAITGHEDGSVHFWKNDDLTLVYVWHPLASYVDAPIRAPTKGGNARTPAFPARTTLDSMSQESGSLAITHVAVGPKGARPTLFVVCTEGGQILTQPLRDFLFYEKYKAPSALAQMVAAPFNAVKGTVQQAQSIVSWTLGGASGFATQARGFAGEALSEARAMAKNVGQGKVIKSLADMFGFRKSSDTSPRPDDDASPL